MIRPKLNTKIIFGTPHCVVANGKYVFGSVCILTQTDKRNGHRDDTAKNENVFSKPESVCHNVSVSKIECPSAVHV